MYYQVIRDMCKEKNINLYQIAKSAGVSNAIYKWDKSAPSVEKLARIADLIGVSVDEIILRARDKARGSHE